MNEELWRKVEDLFHAAFERGSSAMHFSTRLAVEGPNCAAGRAVRGQRRTGRKFPGKPAIEDMTVAVTSAESALGRQFGPYCIVSLLGSAAWARYIGHTTANRAAKHQDTAFSVRSAS
jgi:hypothetical protein